MLTSVCALFSENGMVTVKDQSSTDWHCVESPVLPDEDVGAWEAKGFPLS